MVQFIYATDMNVTKQSAQTVAIAWEKATCARRVAVDFAVLSANTFNARKEVAIVVWKQLPQHSVANCRSLRKKMSRSARTIIFLFEDIICYK